MTLRPRYSLLSLLLLTALVAGGVKLWHGPHHVVEEKAPGKQLEYTYTRAWNGAKTVHGPCILRFIEPAGPHKLIVVIYVRQDEKLGYYYMLAKQSKTLPQVALLTKTDFEVFQRMPISASEQFVFRQAIERERQHTDQDPGKEYTWLELIGNAYDSGEKMRNFSDLQTFYHQTLNMPWNSFLRAL